MDTPIDAKSAQKAILGKTMRYAKSAVAHITQEAEQIVSIAQKRVAPSLVIRRLIQSAKRVVNCFRFINIRLTVILASIAQELVPCLQDREINALVGRVDM